MSKATCYIERSKVREILISHEGINSDTTSDILKEVDALHVFTSDDFTGVAQARQQDSDIGILLSVLRNFEDAVGEDIDDTEDVIAQIEADYLARVIVTQEGSVVPSTEKNTHACMTCWGDKQIQTHADGRGIDCPDCNGTGRGPAHDPAIDGPSIPSTHQRCAKCGCETKGEAALVDGKIWCHPCADMVPSTHSEGGK